MIELYPGQAYYHEYNKAVRETEERWHDLQRVKEITEEALHPTSPTPGHSLMCPCHRCRMYREGLQ